MTSLYILNIGPLSDTWFCTYFPPFCCLFIATVSLPRQMILAWWFLLFAFACIAFAFGIKSKKIIWVTMLKDFSVFLRRFVALGFMFQAFRHFELVLVYWNMDGNGPFSFASYCLVLPIPLELRVHSWLYCPVSQLPMYIGLFCELYIFSLWSVSLFLCQPPHVLSHH